jgi:hypothetical protein
MHKLGLGAQDPPPYVVVCLEQDRSAGEGHEHVVAVETRDPDGGTTRWTTVEVIGALREGERFAIDRNGIELSAAFEPAVCPRCAMVTLTVPSGRMAIAPCA